MELYHVVMTWITFVSHSLLVVVVLTNQGPSFVYASPHLQGHHSII